MRTNDEELQILIFSFKEMEINQKQNKENLANKNANKIKYVFLYWGNFAFIATAKLLRKCIVTLGKHYILLFLLEDWVNQNAVATAKCNSKQQNRRQNRLNEITI